jgi:UDP-3-O-[3-hydroxymyristoyl] glucosamine N-acyltransferase
MKIPELISKVTYKEIVGDILDFYDVEIEPKEIHFAEFTLHLGSLTLIVQHGRYAFAQALHCFEEPKMCRWPSIKVADNTLFTEEVVYGDYCTIGGSGFGYVRHGEEILRIPHLGKVEIGQRVVLHNHVNIDRGVVGSTVIGDDCKLDSFVHIAHGVKIGKGNTLAAHTIIEGSCEIGENNVFGTGVIVQRKVKIGKNNIFGSGCVVTKDIGNNGVYVGNPARSL